MHAGHVFPGATFDPAPFLVVNVNKKIVYVICAGLVPGVPLQEQQLLSLVTMRNLVRKTDADEQEGCSEAARRAADNQTKNVEYVAVESDKRGEPWAPLWRGPEHIYFGHDAKRRLQLCKFATGLDTGCLYGGALSAAILQVFFFGGACIVEVF